MGPAGGFHVLLGHGSHSPEFLEGGTGDRITLRWIGPLLPPAKTWGSHGKTRDLRSR